MYEDVPPLKVWAYSALAAFSLQFLFLFYSYSPFGPYAKVLASCHRSLTDALIENNARDTSAISVVILGSSLTEHALSNPNEIEERILKQTKRRTNVLRVALNYMSMDLAERIDFFEYISKYPPQYLIIENFSMNLEFEDGSSIPVPIEAALLDLRNQFRSTLRLRPHENYYTKWYTFNTKPLPESGFYSDKFDSVTFKKLQTKKCMVREASRNSIANSAYDALLKINTKVIFLDMTQSNKLQTNFLDKSSTAELNKLLEFYRQHYSIDYWQYPGIMNDSCFVDGIHLNYKGSKKYQEWFASEFDSIK